MRHLRNILVLILFIGIFYLVQWIEMTFIPPHFNIIGSALIVMATILLWGVIGLYIFLFKPNNKKISDDNIRHKGGQRAKSNNPPTIIPKPLGGFRREQLNEIYLHGILLHQIYYSAAGDNFSERLQREALNIQMRFFITVFPQRDISEYFDFTENFMSENESLCNFSVSRCIERSIGILRSCNDKQIRKLQSLYKTLTALYFECGGGNKTALITYSSMLDTELASLIVEDD